MANSENHIFTFTCAIIIGQLIMANSGNQIFTFTWQIDYWRMQPSTTVFESPPFVVDFLDNTEWSILFSTGPTPYLGIFPFIGLKRRAQKSEERLATTIAYSLAVHSTHSHKYFKSEKANATFIPDQFYTHLIPKFYEYEDRYLLNVTLTIRCQMSRYKEEVKNKGVVLEDLKSNFWNSRVPFGKYECSVRSRVRVTSKSFVWTIQRIGELPNNVTVSTSLPSVTKSELSFDFSLYLKEGAEEGKKIYIEIHIRNKDLFRGKVACRIKTIGAPRNIKFEGKDQFEFWLAEDIWLFPDFFKMTDLTERYLDHTNGTLYLQVELSFSISGDIAHIETIEGFPLDVKQREISHASTTFGKLYRDRVFADVTLLVGDRELKAHKLILITGSDVFRSMFESVTKEENGIVEIDDLDPETVERLLKYMYTDEVEVLNSEDAVKLYCAAARYSIDSLKGRLHPRLIASLSVSTVCEMLVLADSHNDEDLWASIVDYISRNTNEIFSSDYWKNFTSNHSSLSARSMQEVFKTKSPF